MPDQVATGRHNPKLMVTVELVKKSPPCVVYGIRLSINA
jgi:hypothetical protein